MLHGSIGDVARALPLAGLLRLGFPNAYLAWSIEPAAYPLVVGHSAVDEIILFDRKRWWQTFVPFLKTLRAKRFDLVLDLQRHLKSGVISWCTGAARRVGFNKSDSKEGNWLFNNSHIDAAGEEISKLEHYLKFADTLGIARAPIEWSFSLTMEEQASVDRYLAPVAGAYAVIFVGTRWESKRWFPRQMADCATMLHADFGLDIFLIGGKEDQFAAREAAKLAKCPVLNITGLTSLREAIGIIQRAKLAVGPDTGLMHIAAGVETPVISLFGATDPRRTGPYAFGDLVLRGRAPCVPCHQRHCPIGRICMQSITTAEIKEKVILALGRDRLGRMSHAYTG
ncbi:MAG TPA: glycosyltransferase family 9 protein [Candidatus Binatus sp.]|nr:glycosyltransferase family 9 protein [Candidatus Binatus sp.]